MKTAFAVGIPLTLYALWLEGVFFVNFLVLLMTCAFTVFGLMPFIFKHSYTFQRNMLFLPFLPWPRENKFNDPEVLGLPGTRNFYITTDQGIQLGVWHVVPDHHIETTKTFESEESFDTLLNSGETVILYMHGNSGSRAGPHRVELYKVLRKLGFHIITFDYRGYADSSAVPPCEFGVVSDGKFMFEWVRQRTSSFIVWGHSLGTGVSSHVVDLAISEGNKPKGLILESPFNNLQDEIRHHPLAKAFSFLPWFESFFVEPFKKNNLLFESDKHITNIHIPLMILHAEDDRVVPFHLGEKLFRSAKEAHPNNQDNIEFVRFSATYGYAHKFICSAPELPQIVRSFVQKCNIGLN